MGKLYLFLTFLLCSSLTVLGQCGDTETFTVCDMTIIDGDGNGTADGIINLYDEFSALSGTTITPADGMWFDPDFNFALDAVTGDLFLWDLDSSSENITDYQFEFLNGSSGCPDDVQFLFNIVLGPYSGTVANTMDGAVNLQVCQAAPPAECLETTNIDLFQTMLSNPSPHSNGQWTYMGTSPNFVGISGNRFLNVNVPYQSGPPLVDEETFELEYTVPGITPCATEQVTTVVVSVVREPFAGFANQINICETELIAGDFDSPIDLLEDSFLVNENTEGIWLAATDDTGQISGPGDSNINLSEIYADLIATNPRFGSETYEFQYFVESRSTICGDDTSTIGFTFYESVRPFMQNEEVSSFCSTDETLTTVDLYDYIAFTQEGNTLYDYPNDAYTNWTLVSGPSDLGLISNTGNIATIAEDPEYTSQGTIDLSNLDPNIDAGTYVFEFTVDESYNAVAEEEEIFDSPDGCTSETNMNHPCESQTTQITIVITNPNYAGENTEGLEFCESDGNLVLTDLLETDGMQAVYVGPEGVWTDLDTGLTVDNNFIIPEITGGSQDFNFIYNTTTTAANCADSATLSFTIFEQYSAGEDAIVTVCLEDGEVDLFSFLGGDPDINGTWSGPAGFTSDTNEAIFNPASDVEGDYIYTVPENGECESESATITVSLGITLYPGEDTTDVELCFSEITNPIDLVNLLTTNGVDIIYEGPEGTWTDTVSGDPISNPYTVGEIDEQETFEFTYTTTSVDGCVAQAQLSFTVYEQYEAGTGALYETCEDGSIIDLFTLLTDNPDTNGTWSGPNEYTTTDNTALFDPSVNEEGEYVYTIPANGTCEEVTATVIVNFLGTNYAGENTSNVELCNILADNPIDLITLLATNGVDTIYTGPQGEWTETTSGNTIINPFTIPAISGEQTFEFTYTTTSDQGCGDSATLSFTVFESGSAGTGDTYETCEDGTVIDLFTLLTNTPDTTGTWSGPDGYTTIDNVALYDPSINDQGNYIYIVPSNGACPAVNATISVVFFDTNYAGENTTGVEVCESETTIDLIALLDDNGVDTIYSGPDGEFTDATTGDIIANPFTIPEIDGMQTFEFIYTTTTQNGCGDQATLSFTIFEQEDAGQNAAIEICEDSGVFNLFDVLGGTPETSGSWTGPNGYTEPSNLGSIDPSIAVSGDYVYTIPANGACAETSATVSLTIVQTSNAGADMNTFLCPGMYTASLFDLLSDDTETNGEFIDLDTSQTIIDGLVDVGSLGTGTFSYLYVITNDTCGDDDAMITISITAVQEPVVEDPVAYCLNEGISLGDLQVTGTENFEWYAFAEAGDPLPLSTLLVNNTTYYVSAVDANGCESNRVPYLANILSLNDGSCQIISDGVSDNDDGQNDFLELGTLPDVFPNFDIQIFNRYGTIVYRGNRNTPLFDGSSNTGSGLGDQLPTGVYFYIFYPNDVNAQPIEGTFYLSR